MRKQIQLVGLFIFIITLFTSCEVVESIFKVGMGVGIFIVIAVIAVIIIIISKFRGNK